MSAFESIKQKVGNLSPGNVVGGVMNFAGMIYDYHYYKEYGTGAGLIAAGISGAVTSVPLSLGIAAVQVGTEALNSNYDKQLAKTKSSFSSSNIQDQFGNIATMRQRSQYSLSRNRNALGKEAQLFHMRF